MRKMNEASFYKNLWATNLHEWTRMKKLGVASRGKGMKPDFIKTISRTSTAKPHLKLGNMEKRIMAFIKTTERSDSFLKYKIYNIQYTI